MTHKVRAAGELPAQKHAVFAGKMPPVHTRDPALPDKPKRKCARCGTRFQRTYKRRMLCAGCYGRAGGYDE